MKQSFTILLLLISAGVWGQVSEVDSVDYYISMLNPNSAMVGTAYVPRLELDNNAQRLIALKGKEITQKLYAHLGEKEKTVAIHAILTRRFHLKSSVSQTSNYKGDTVSALDFTYNGLKWHYDLSSGQSAISDDAVKYAQSYWRKKIKKE